MPECPPWALRPFVRSCICAPARPCTRVPVPPSPSPERVKCPGSSAGRPGHSARSGRTRAAGGNAAAGGVERTAWRRDAARRGRPGLQAVAGSAVGSPHGRAGGTSGCVRPAGPAFRPLGWTRAREHASTRAGEGVTGTPPPAASGRNAVPAGGAAAAFRPLAVGTQVRARAAADGWNELTGGAGRPAGVVTALQPVACTACASCPGRAGEIPGCVRRATRAFRPLADRTHGTGRRADADAGTGTGTHGRGPRPRPVREARRAGIGSRTWQPRMTASSGSTAR
jgi:hypothetical protein